MAMFLIVFREIEKATHDLKLTFCRLPSVMLMILAPNRMLYAESKYYTE